MRKMEQGYAENGLGLCGKWTGVTQRMKWGYAENGLGLLGLLTLAWKMHWDYKKIDE